MPQSSPEILTFTCKGGSMRPLIKSGQEVNVKKREIIRAGDCIAYHLEENHYIHRVIAVKNDMYKIASDSASIKTHWIPASFVDGKVISPHMFLKGTPGMIYFYCIHTIFLIARFIKYLKS